MLTNLKKNINYFVMKNHKTESINNCIILPRFSKKVSFSWYVFYFQSIVIFLAGSLQSMSSALMAGAPDDPFG